MDAMIPRRAAGIGLAAIVAAAIAIALLARALGHR